MMRALLLIVACSQRPIDSPEQSADLALVERLRPTPRLQPCQWDFREPPTVDRGLCLVRADGDIFRVAADADGHQLLVDWRVRGAERFDYVLVDNRHPACSPDSPGHAYAHVGTSDWWFQFYNGGCDPPLDGEIRGLK